MKITKSDWDDLLQDEYQKPYFQQLQLFIDKEYKSNLFKVFPNKVEIYKALSVTPYEKIKVVIIGQDPYIKEGQAHGLAFSVNPGIKIPPSLMNIYHELENDLGCYIPNHGCLTWWAIQGVLLLNTVLTVRERSSNSHAGIGWESFTDRIIELVNNKNEPIVFMLWGRHAQQKMDLLNNKKHLILTAAHPSPFSAHSGFFGCKHFSKCNDFFEYNKITKIDWQIQVM